MTDLITRIQAGGGDNAEVLRLLKYFTVFVELAVDVWDDCPYPDAFRRKVKEAHAILRPKETPSV